MILITVFPKQRIAGGDVEKHEVWAFALGKPLKDLGEALGLWQMEGKTPRYLLNGSVSQDCLQEIGIDILNPTFELTRQSAAFLNGFLPSEIKVTAIGMGALGSQVSANLVRSGFGVWTGIDPDFLLPHNVARHELSGMEVGQWKVFGMQHRLNSILTDSATSAFIVASVLNPAEKVADVNAAFEDAELILDFSASPAGSLSLLAH